MKQPYNSIYRYESKMNQTLRRKTKPRHFHPHRLQALALKNPTTLATTIIALEGPGGYNVCFRKVAFFIVVYRRYIVDGYEGAYSE